MTSAVHREERTVETADGLRLYSCSWGPAATQPRARVLLVHGFAEHAGRYAHVARHLVARGYAFDAIDQRTHGRSPGQPRVYLTGLDQAVADLLRFRRRIQSEHPGQRLFLYGHSMGALIALAWALRFPEGLSGFISSGTPLELDTTMARPTLLLARLAARLRPTLPLVSLQLDGISRDPAVVKAYHADPLVHAGRLRAGMAIAFSTALANLRARIAELTLPLLVLHGGADPTTPPSGSERLHASAGSADKTLKIYPGLYHELHNEPEQIMVLDDIAAWLDARPGPGATYA